MPIKQFLLAEPGKREMIGLGLILALISCLPFFVVHYPQMTDYPSHLARYHVMLDGGRSAWLAKYYSFEWRWTGNVGIDLLIWPFAKMFGLELGSKILSGMIPPLLGLAIMTLSWTLHRRIGVGTFLAFVTIWSPTLLLGLLNFSLAVALALFAFCAWIRLAHWKWRWLAFVPISIIVWLCHIAGWGVLGLLVLCYELQRKPAFASLLSPWPLTLPIAFTLHGGGAMGLAAYGKNVLNYKMSIWFMALRDQSMTADINALMILLAAIVAAMFFRRSDPRLIWTALVLFLLSLIIPRHFGGGDYSDYRLIAVGLMLGCLAINWGAPRLLFWLAPSLYLLRLASVVSVWQVGSQETEAMLKVLDHVPQGARIASAVPEKRYVWPVQLYQHVASYAVVRRDALVNTNFAEPGVHMLHMREAGPEYKDPSQRILYFPGDKIDLSKFVPAQQADYLWYIGTLKPDVMPPGAVILCRTPHTFLARLAKVPPAR